MAAFEQGIPVTGRVVWHSDINTEDGSCSGSEIESQRGSGSAKSMADSGYGGPDTRWISATPLVGSDDRVGVWMVVIIRDPYAEGC